MARTIDPDEIYREGESAADHLQRMVVKDSEGILDTDSGAITSTSLVDIGARSGTYRTGKKRFDSIWVEDPRGRVRVHIRFHGMMVRIRFLTSNGDEFRTYQFDLDEDEVINEQEQ